MKQASILASSDGGVGFTLCGLLNLYGHDLFSPHFSFLSLLCIRYGTSKAQ